MNIDFFIILLIPMLAYGFVQNIQRQSRTTFIVIKAIFIIAFSSKYFSTSIILLEVYVFLMFLFIRAVFRKKLKNVKNKFLKGFFYA